MSMPSDSNPDISEAMERTTRPPKPPGPSRSQLTSEQTGWAAAAFVAFLGVTYFGPALARWRRRPTLRERLAQRADAAREDARRRARAARKQAWQAGRATRKSARRLGGSIWR